MGETILQVLSIWPVLPLCNLRMTPKVCLRRETLKCPGDLSEDIPSKCPLSSISSHPSSPGIEAMPKSVPPHPSLVHRQPGRCRPSLPTPKSFERKCSQKILEGTPP